MTILQIMRNLGNLPKMEYIILWLKLIKTELFIILIISISCFLFLVYLLFADALLMKNIFLKKIVTMATIFALFLNKIYRTK